MVAAHDAGFFLTGDLLVAWIPRPPRAPVFTDWAPRRFLIFLGRAA